MGSTQPEFKNPATASLLELAKARRTYYGLKSESPISDDAIESIVQDAVLHVPSSFNTQTSRVVLLLKEEHEKVWDIAISVMEGLVAAGQIPQEMFESQTKPKLSAFRAAYGTVLFFVDFESLDPIKEKFPMYAAKFDPFAVESNAMSQYLVWTALQSEGFGANLQHYSPLIDEQIQKTWNLPASWKLDAQLVFGTPTGEPGEKTFLPLEDRFKVFGK
ncbi:putative nitroreductase family protein [Aspergillus clavatus NRRL 1]|uniref:Nitroreductase family protein, putative n=1 Tax=Aspergillus clavatus (strain ATCC 1007 / CBS 513.65 / DSM 816 / NCTC 3887 / NRRL 1 / QM 1276 / 107) TaxID=344612 RepID=A1CAV5_ASPCL|nr:nitroreductase family protein, putative [Aspergillus clavatus NRRL 1]EAW12873.1 nitroreductase family protein, putative [Aspergillus clavatus NRRL 1]